jgi:predicted ATPase
VRLVQLKVSNFRCFKDETTVALDDLVVLIGKNDSGKSSLLDAMNIFFNGVPEQDDLCVHASDQKLTIACVFDDLPKQLVIDEQYPTDLAVEYLLNQTDKLEIAMVFNCTGSGKVKPASVFARAKHPTADKYDDLLTLTNAKLKQRAKELGVDVTTVNQTVNTELRRAIWAHAPDLKLQLTDIEPKSETAERIWDQLKKHLPVFALFKSDRSSTDQDSEAQDPMKSAIKEAIKAQEDTLSTIADKVKQEVQEIANRTVEKIREMNPELASQLTPRVTTKNWDTLFSVSLTGDEDIPINKRGSGTRRLVLLNFFRARAEKEAEGKGANIIYAIEEPETSQHPHNQKMLVEAIQDLAARDGCQVFLTTHTPVLARRFPQTALRFVTQRNGRPHVLHGDNEETLSEIIESLGVLPDHKIKAFLGVEGRHDITFLCHISRMLTEAGEDVPDLGKAEDEGILVFVPLGGNNLDLWVSRLKGFNRPEFYLMDRDTQPPEEPKYHAIAEELKKRTNCTVWTTEKRELENYIHPDVIKEQYPAYSGTGEAFEDVPLLLAQAVHEASKSGQPWAGVLADTGKLAKKVSKAKTRLCKEFASKMTRDHLNKIDTNNEVRTWLAEIGKALNAE